MYRFTDCTSNTSLRGRILNIFDSPENLEEKIFANFSAIYGFLYVGEFQNLENIHTPLIIGENAPALQKISEENSGTWSGHW